MERLVPILGIAVLLSACASEDVRLGILADADSTSPAATPLEAPPGSVTAIEAELVLEPPAGLEPAVFVAEGVRVLVPHGALSAGAAFDLTVARATLAEAVLALPHDDDGLSSPLAADRTALVLGPAGAFFDEPIAIEIAVDAEGRGIDPSALADHAARIVPLYAWQGGAWSRSGLVCEPGVSRQGFAILRAEHGRLLLTALVDHLATYAIPTIDPADPFAGEWFGLELLGAAEVAPCISMRAPTATLGSLGPLAETLRSHVARRQAYEEVLAELVWETGVVRETLVAGLPYESIDRAVRLAAGCRDADCWIEEDAVAYVRALDDATWAYGQAVAEERGLPPAVQRAVEALHLQRMEMDLVAPLLGEGTRSYAETSRCVVGTLRRAALPILLDVAEVQHRWDAIEPRLRLSPLFATDPAFIAAVSALDSWVRALPEETFGGFVAALPELFAHGEKRGVGGTCRLPSLGPVSAGLVHWLAAQGAEVSVAATTLPLVGEAPLTADDAVVQAARLSALATVLTAGNLGIADLPLGLHASGAPCLGIPEIPYEDAGIRDVWYRVGITARAASALAAHTAALVLAPPAEWRSPRLDWMVRALCDGPECAAGLADSYAMQAARLLDLRAAVDAAMDATGPDGGPPPEAIANEIHLP